VAENLYDVIVVGARCGGSPTAMLLARKGYKVLVVDRATFPSDTISTHLIHPLGMAALRRWGLRDRLVATGCPPIDTYSFDFGPFTLSGWPGTNDEPVAYAPRRTVLDKLLVNAAAEAGAEVREGFTVEALDIEDGRVTGIRGHTAGGRTITERARTVIGADGQHSLVAETVGAAQYHVKPPIQVSYYSYWRGLPMNGRFETFVRPHRAFAAWPTNDDLTVVIAGVPYAEFDANRRDIEGTFHRTLALVPSFAARLEAATRAESFKGTAVPGFFRTPFGPGWALVGDAGYNKDFITAQGIQDAFLDAELCAAALDATYSGQRPYEVAMREYQETRDGRVQAMYELTAQFASLEPPSPEMQQLLGAVNGNKEAMNEFARVIAGVTSPNEFFAPANAARLIALAH